MSPGAYEANPVEGNGAVVSNWARYFSSRTTFPGLALRERLPGVRPFCANSTFPFSAFNEEIESESIERVAEPSGLSGGKLDHILFQNDGNILVLGIPVKPIGIPN